MFDLVLVNQSERIVPGVAAQRSRHAQRPLLLGFHSFVLFYSPPPWVPSPMPSLFSRSRTTSTPTKSLKPHTDSSDEFGRVTSRGSTRGTATVPARKDKNVEKPRIRTLSTSKGKPPAPIPPVEDEPVIPDGSFFPLNLDPPTADPASPSDPERGLSYISSSFHRRPTRWGCCACRPP